MDAARAAFQSLFPCARHRRVAPVPAVMVAQVEAQPVPAPPPTESPDDADIAAREGLIHWLDAWGQVDQAAVRAWLKTSPPPLMYPILEEDRGARWR